MKKEGLQKNSFPYQFMFRVIFEKCMEIGCFSFFKFFIYKNRFTLCSLNYNKRLKCHGKNVI